MSRNDEVGESAAIAATLGLGELARRPKRLRWVGLLLLALAALVPALYWFGASEQPSAARFETTAAVRGKLTVTVSATGTLQPTNQVDVGSEQSGTIESVFVDDNDRVTEGQVLAKLDTRKLVDQVAKSRAALAAAAAKVLQATAARKEDLAKLKRLREVARLSGGKVPSLTELETAEAAFAQSEADVASARASVGEARATLRTDETNLSKASIRSPIDGVVLARVVEPGQTVAASLQAPVLFTIAESLSQMQLSVSVDEADVGQVREGQPAVFNVDAYPNREYPATILRVSFGSQVTDGVVSYPTLLAVNNDDLSLRPGMTATAEIKTAERNDVLLVPNAALRYTPQQAKQDQRGGGLVAMMLPRRPPRRPQERNLPDQEGRKRLWVLRDGQPVPLRVAVGASDGRMTEVSGGDLQAGMLVITDTVAGNSE